MTGLLVAAAVMGLGPWELNAPKVKDWSQELTVNVAVSIDGQEHAATFKQKQTLTDATDPKLKVLWTGIEVDGNPQDEQSAWNFKLNPNGAIQEPLEKLDMDYVRMLAPFTFVYPNKAVAVGDKWEAKIDKFEYSFEAKAEDRIQNDDVLKVSGKLKENGASLESDGTYWIGKDGKLRKFETKVKHWPVPFSGSPEMDATITGKAS